MTFSIAHTKVQRLEGPCGRPPEINFAALRLCVIFFLLSFSVSAKAQTNTLSDAEIQGHKLAEQILDQTFQTKFVQNETNHIQNGILHIRDGSGGHLEFNFYCQYKVTPTETRIIYTAFQKTNESAGQVFLISVTQGRPSCYLLGDYQGRSKPIFLLKNGQVSEKIMTSFVGSDFWLADLTLEFFHWPQQKVLPKTTNLKRGRDYTLLESTNPNPATNGYSRVLSWIDKETGGILEAEAYDFNGKLLKDFAPKSFKKVNGQWELQEMEIRNVQTGSRTRLEFDLKK